MIELLASPSPRTVGIRCSGRLHDEDFHKLEPVIETTIAKQGTVRLLAQFEDFHGWDMHAALDELRIGLKHSKDFEKIALVGDHDWERWIAKLTRLFTTAPVRYFDSSEHDLAWTWLEDESFLSFH